MISAERATEIAELYYDDIYHLCFLRLKSESDAEDVVQEVFLFFQKNCDNLEDNFIKAWLYAVADNKIKEQFRFIAKREKELLLRNLLHINAQSQIDMATLFEIEEDNKISDEELDEKKKSILASLNEKELELFHMIYTKNMEYTELAKALDVSEHAVRSRVYRLRLKIKKYTSRMFMVLLLMLIRL